MNAKLCKRLRRIAREATVGKPLVAYVVDARGCVRLAPGCTRQIYRQLKRSFA